MGRWGDGEKRKIPDAKHDEFVKSPLGPAFVIPAPFYNGVNSSRNPGFPVKAGTTSGLRFSPE
jgi:hypothetical protein